MTLAHEPTRNLQDHCTNQDQGMKTMVMHFKPYHGGPEQWMVDVLLDVPRDATVSRVDMEPSSEFHLVWTDGHITPMHAMPYGMDDFCMRNRELRIAVGTMGDEFASEFRVPVRFT